ncbi:glycoside hydrolase family 13 protein [Aegicerativicinus sediminis]
MKYFNLIIFCMSLISYGQIERVEPPNWWVGFSDHSLQLLIKGENIQNAEVEISNKHIELVKVNKADSPNYLFLDLIIKEDAIAGNFDIEFELPNGKNITHSYTLKSRDRLAEGYIGFNSSDVIYLITPDRFANGDIANDIVSGLRETSINRKNDYGRHGGDIQGMIDHIDYIHDMGFTSVWPTPLLMNDMTRSSYHGYAITDFYQVDPRFGTLDDYKQLAQKLQGKGMKLIMDQVANHCGSLHWWMSDLPFKDWVNYQSEYLNKEGLKVSNHRRTVNQDPYASGFDKELMSKGWFVNEMPDLNQRNPFLAKYIIQNSLWWIETLHLEGIRQDTYPYSYKEFMAEWAGAIMREYPNFNIVGEEWSTNPLLVGYWQQGANNKDGYKSNLKSTMDFPMQHTIVRALNEEEGWNSGLVNIYEGLANDFYYPDPQSILIFPDNHDMDRIFTQLHEDVTNTKMAVGLMLCMPRIPQVYYGTEILMQNTAKPGDHGLIRTDFPGGWEGDSKNAFTGKGLSAPQKEMQSFMKNLLNYRLNSEAIHEGKTVHFAPINGVYIMTRATDKETVVVIINKNDKPSTLDLSPYSELNLDGQTLQNVVTNETVKWQNQLSLPNKGIYIFSSAK